MTKAFTPSQRPLLALLVTLALASSSIRASKVYNIHWNASNPIFRIDKTDNIIDVNAGNHPSEYDQVNIVCPVYKANLDESRQERYIIYLVSREEFKSCRISQPNPRVIAVCNRPYDFMYFTITFRSFTPTPGGLEFHPGQDYYFISTSTASDLHRRVGGSCSSHNMKLIFKVADGDTKVDDNVLESVDTVKESRTRYHPWHMPEAPANEAPLVAPKPSVQANPPAGPAFYYPIQELERAVELRESQKRSNGLNFSIYRGARKAFGVGVSDDADADVTSGVSRTASVMTLLQIAIAVVAVALRAACH